jgi:hypothetical protein
MIISNNVPAIYPFTIQNGQKSWIQVPGDKYDVTGQTRDGKRFRMVFDRYATARCINLWRGSVWLRRGSKRYLITRTYN